MDLNLKVSPVLPSEEFIMPVLKMMPADVFFNLLHLPIIRKNDHHGCIAFVWHHHDRSLVDRVLIDVIAASSFHHVNLHGVSLSTLKSALLVSCASNGLSHFPIRTKCKNFRSASTKTYLIVITWIIALNEREVSTSEVHIVNQHHHHIRVQVLHHVGNLVIGFSWRWTC